MESNFTLVSLLPYSTNILIKDVVQKYNLFKLAGLTIEMLFEAISAFEEMKFEKFDAQVGETLCQIRAYKINRLSENPGFARRLEILKINLSKTKETLALTLLKYDELLKLNKKERPSDAAKPFEIEELFLKYDLYLPLSQSEVFIYSAYFLNKHNVVNESLVPVAINYQLVKKTFQISSSYSKKIIHFHQKLLSKLSCEFIFKLLVDEGRMALPCFPVTEIILLHMIKTRALLTIYVKENEVLTALGFIGNPETNDFELLGTIPYNRATLIMYGTRENKIKNSISELIQGFSLKSIILYNNAAHPQYTGKTLLDYQQNPYRTYLNSQPYSDKNNLIQKLSHELESKISMATVLGCTHKNRSLFFLEHIFCSNINNFHHIFNKSIQNTSMDII